MESERVVRVYKERVSAVWLDCPRYVPAREWYPATVLHCKTIDPDRLPKGFANSITKARLAGGQAPKFQYRVGELRPVAYRTPFLSHPCFKDSLYTVSHLCHNNSCYNWDHHVLEPLVLNQMRGGCPGGSHCHHTVPCLMPGPYSEL